MPQYTSRLKLIKPLSGEGANNGRAQYNTNFDTIDTMPGIFVCTSGTRPSSPFEGQTIYETDRGEIATYRGTKWEYDSNKQWRNKTPLWGTFDTTHRVRAIGGNQVLTPNAGQVYSIPLPNDMKSLLSINLHSGDENNGHYYVFINTNPFISSGARFSAFAPGTSGRLTVPSRVIWDAMISY